MAKPHKLELTEAEIQALVELRDNGEPAYLRERASAILKIHAGFSAHEVARNRLLKRRDPDTVYTWLLGSAGIASRASLGCFINPAGVENLRFFRGPLKPLRQRS